MLSSWWKRLVLRETPLVPGVVGARIRTYSADSGYVYEYRFAGFRHIRLRGEPVHEYVFLLRTGRTPEFSVAVRLHEAALRTSIGQLRELSASERHGVATIALKRALDAWDHPSQVDSDVTPDPAELIAIGEILDL